MLWGAFNNASSAMMAMSWDMGSISQNIANVNTTGYKRKETLFQTVMSESHATPSTYSGRLNVFGVQTADRYHIAAQGVIAPSNHGTDLAINGSGFFLVSPADDTGGAPATVSTSDPNQVLYTRDGSFRFKSGADDQNYFVTGSGHYLMGWMADDTGEVSTTGTLEPLYTTPTTIMQGRATTSGTINANIPADATVTPSNFSVTASVTDAGGTARDLTLTWARAGANSWTVTPSHVGATGFVPPSWTVTMDAWGNVSAPTPANQALAITWGAGYGSGTTSPSINVPQGKPSIHLEKIHMAVYDAAYAEHAATVAFERTGANSWYMHVSAGQNATAGTAPAPVQLTFDGNGRLTSPTGDQSVTLSWTSGATTSTATVGLDISNLTQYDGDLHLVTVEQDGYGRGTLLRSTFDEKGELKGYFTNGETRTLFKVPIAQFVSENRLDPITGNLFRRTQEAGDITVSAVEDSVGQTRFVTSSLETSTVDIEDEFTKMIVTQKAYSTNATVFKTADEMTTVARDLKA